jgi:hypothetical protein
MTWIKKIIAVLICAVFVFAQSNRIETEFSFSSDQKIIDYSTSSGYISMITKRSAYPYYTGYLYKKNGLKLFEKTLSKGKFLLNLPLEKAGIHLIAISGHEGDEESDRMYAYDLENGNLIWEATSVAAHYDISPNQKALLTRSLPVDGRSAQMEVIYLSDGRKELIGIPFVSARWYTDSTIIFVQQFTKKNVNVEKKLRHLFEQRKKLQHAKRKLSLQLKNEMIEKNEYQQRLDRISRDQFNLRAETKRVGRNSQRTTLQPANVALYNTANKTIELIKEVRTANRSTFFMSNDTPIGSIFIDRENADIFLIGNAISDQEKRITSEIVKLDKNFNLDWSQDVSNYTPKIYITDQSNVLLLLKMNAYFHLDRQTGKLQKSLIDIGSADALRGGILRTSKAIKISDNKVTFYTKVKE